MLQAFCFLQALRYGESCCCRDTRVSLTLSLSLSLVLFLFLSYRHRYRNQDGVREKRREKEPNTVEDQIDHDTGRKDDWIMKRG